MIQDSADEEEEMGSACCYCNCKNCKFVAYLYLIIPFQYVLHYQLFLCLDFLSRWFDNSLYLIGFQKPIRREWSKSMGA